MSYFKIMNYGIAVFLITTFFSCNQKQRTDGYTIKGTINGLDSGMVKLVQYDQTDRTSTTLDSTRISGGTFQLEGEVVNPEMMSLVFEPGNWALAIFMENKKITVEADTTGANHYDYSRYGGAVGAQLNSYSVSGSLSHDQFGAFEDHPENQKFKDILIRLTQRFEKASDSEKENIRQEGDSIRELRDLWESHWLDSFIRANPSSTAGAYLFNNYYQFHEDLPLDKHEATLALFQGQAKASVYYEVLKDKLQKRKVLEPGKIAPDFTAVKPDSSSFDLSSTRGQYVLLDFWASWCAPCRASIPHWKNVYAKYHDKGFEIVSITNDSKWSDWIKALDEEKMPWIHVTDDFPVKNMPARIATLYMIPYLPTYVLLDSDGKILLHNGTEAEIEKILEAKLGA